MTARRMRVTGVLLMIAGAACSTDTPGAGTTQPQTSDLQRTARLTGASEVPPVATGATGEVTALLQGLQLSVNGSFQGLESDLFDVQGSPAHLHDGRPGVNGPIVVALTVTPGADRRSGQIAFQGELTEEQARAFEDGTLYVNVHSEDHQSGEIRGQLGANQPDVTVFDVELSPQNEVPPVSASGTGTATATLQDDVLVITGTFSGLSAPLEDVSGSPGHVHLAPAGENGDIVFNLDVVPASDGLSGTFSVARVLTQAEEVQARAGLFYVNFHTAQNTTGELRGQLVPQGNPGATFVSALTGANEVPPVQTTATGDATAVLRGRQLVVEGSVSGLDSELFEVGGSPAHVHEGAVGENGPILVPLTMTADADGRGGTFQATVDLTNEQITALAEGRTYVNVHSQNHQSGEIRGQLFFTPPQPRPLSVALTGSEEVPPVETTAAGTATATLDGLTLGMTGDFRNLSSAVEDVQGAPTHVHQAARGDNGPILFNLATSADTDGLSGTFEGSKVLTDAERVAFADGLFYVNVHSVDHPTGEIRGQLQRPEPPAPTSAASP